MAQKKPQRERTLAASIAIVDAPELNEVDATESIDDTAPLPNAVEDTPVVEVDDTPPVPEPVVVEPVVEAPAPVVATPPVETVYTYLAARHPEITTLSPMVVSVITRLEQYVAAMGPTTPVTADDGSINQRNLYTILQNAIGATGGEHRIALDAVLYIINRNRDGAFSDRLVMRFMEVTRLTRDAALAFQSLLHLFISTCNPATRRAALRTIDMRRIVDKLGAVQYQQNLLDFYR